MYCFKLLSVVSLVGGCALASASYDLMLLPGTDGRIYRHDPVNNVTLGSYYGDSTRYTVAADTNGLSYLTAESGSGCFVHSYSTGESRGMMSTNTNTRALELIGGALFTVSTTHIRKYDITTGAFLSLSSLATGVDWLSGCSFGTTVHAIGMNTTTKALCVQSLDITTGTLGTLLTTTTIATGTQIGKAAAAQNTFTSAQQMVFSYLSAGTVSYGRMSLTATGQLSSSTVTTSPLAGYVTTNVMPAAVTAHGGWFFYGQDATTSTLSRIRRFNLFNQSLAGEEYTINTPGGTFAPRPNNTFQIANIVAPEPSSLLALGLGGLVMRRRRK